MAAALRHAVRSPDVVHLSPFFARCLSAALAAHSLFMPCPFTYHPSATPGWAYSHALYYRVRCWRAASPVKLPDLPFSHALTLNLPHSGSLLSPSGRQAYRPLLVLACGRPRWLRSETVWHYLCSRLDLLLARPQ